MSEPESDAAAGSDVTGAEMPDEAAATIALAEALADMSNKFAAAEARAASAERRVEQLETRLREAQAQVEELLAASDRSEGPPASGSAASAQPEVEQSPVGVRGGAWWRERRKRRNR